MTTRNSFIDIHDTSVESFDMSMTTGSRSRSRRLRVLPRGLENTANTCYANSALQTMYSLDFFMNALIGCYWQLKQKLKWMVSSDKIVDQVLEKKMPILLQLLDIYERYTQFLNTTSEMETHVVTFKRYIGQHFDGRFGTEFNKDTQQDAGEFFSIITEVLNEEIESFQLSLGGQQPVFNPVEGQLFYLLNNKDVCISCSQISNEVTDHSNLFQVPLTVPDRTLQSAFIRSISPCASEVKCSQCRYNKITVRQFTRIPKVLVFQSARYSIPGVKDSKKMYASYDIYLPKVFIRQNPVNPGNATPLPPSTDRQQQSQVLPAEVVTLTKLINNNNPPFLDLEPLGCERYRLQSIICHHGASTTVGHYVAYVFKDDENGGKWYHCNDSLIREVELSEVINRTAHVSLCYYYVHQEEN